MLKGKIITKKSIIIFITTIFLVNNCIWAEIDKEKFHFELKLSSGMSYNVLGDWNKFMVSSTELIRDMANIYGNEVEGGFDKIHYTIDFLGDIKFYINPHFGISLGAGYLSGRKGKESSKIYVKKPFYSQVSSHDTKVKATPLRIGPFMKLPILSNLSLNINLGIGYYFANWSDSFRNEWGGYWEEIKQDAAGVGWGFYGGSGFEYNILKKMSLVLDIQGKYVKIRGLKGKYDYVNSGGWIDFAEGKLYYYERDLTWMGLDWYSDMKVNNGIPSSPSFRNIRETIIDLSGISIQAGIVIRF